MSTEQPIEPEYKKFMNDLAHDLNTLVRSVFGPETLFMFALFRPEAHSRFNYISSANREDMTKLLEEMVMNFKANAHLTDKPQ